MYTFKQFITEQVEKSAKLTHLTHIEDRTLEGKQGFSNAAAALNNLHGRLSAEHNNPINLSTKYDGSHALVWGHHPTTKKFFVGTKSAFSKNPKLNYTDADIEKNLGHMPHVAKTMKLALHHLPTVTPSEGVYQGDFMYSKDALKRDKNTHVFTPNTITYKTKPGTEHHLLSQQAEIGVVPHTHYQGNDFVTMRAVPGVDLTKFKKHPSVHLISPDYIINPAAVNYSKTSQQKVHNHLTKAVQHYQSVTPKTEQFLQNHNTHLNQYINNQVKNDQTPTVSGYKQFVAGKYKQANTIERKHSEIEQNKQQLADVLAAHHHLAQAKNNLINILASNEPFEHSIGSQAAGPEGYVITHNGVSSKLVNRGQFSRANFAKWGQ